MSELKPCPTAGDYDMADRIISSAARDIEQTYGASFRRDIGRWIVYEGDGEEEVCRCDDSKVAIVLSALRLSITRTFTKADVEAVARAIAEHMEGGLEFDEMPLGRVELRIWAREGMCDVNNATQDEALEAANAALSAIGKVE